ncbi:MAG: crosslink repair DNA glycosylase YcaQ family protein, partial [Chloroflexota bacterium]
MGAVAGLQAQVASAAELMLWARTDRLDAGLLDRLLWEDRALARTWAMRGTLHVLHPADVTLIGAARGGDAPPEAAWFKFFKVSRAGFDSLMEAVPAALSDQPLTRRELADAISREGGAALGQRLLSGWGEFLKPLARRGLLLSGPPRGPEATFVSTQAWLGRQRQWSVVEAGAEAVRRYLAVFGPAGRADFERWLGVRPP